MKNVKEVDATLSVQLLKLREVAELRWDGIVKQIIDDVPMKRVHEQAQNSKIEETEKARYKT